MCGKRLPIVIAVLSLLLLLPKVGRAQQAATDHLEWQQPGAAMADVQSYTYRIYVDGAAAGVDLTGVACSQVDTVLTCRAPLPTLANGPHSLTFTAATKLSDGRVLESSPAGPLAFEIRAVPSAPTNLRIAR